MDAPPDRTAVAGESRWSQARPFLKPLLILVVLAAGIVLLALSPLKDYLRQAELVREQIRSLGAWAPPVYMLCVFVLVSMGMPRLLFCPIGGLAFGLFWGLVWTQIPTLLGYYVLFLFVRWGGRDLILRRWPRLAHVHRVFHKRAVPTIIVMRQLPVSGLVTNMILGLSPISHVDFLLGTAIGLLPEAIPITAIGSGAHRLTTGQSVAFVAALMGFLIVLWLIFSLVVRSTGMFARVRADFAGDGVSEEGSSADGE